MRIVDLSHEISSDMPTWSKPLHVITHRHEDTIAPNPWNYPPGTVSGTEETDVPFTRTMGIWAGIAEHGGSHVDAPFHFNTKGKRINEMPLEIFIANAVLLNLTHKKPKEKITAFDLDVALKKTGETLKPGQAVLMYTGQDKLWYREYDKTGKFEGKEFRVQQSGLSEDAVDWLIEKKVKFFGSDTSMVDWPMNGPVHVRLLGQHGITHAEQLCNLGEIKKSRVLLIALPLKLRDGSASPVRAIAIEDFDINELDRQHSGLR